MIEVKEAIKKAKKHFDDVYSMDAKPMNLMLEEVYMDDESKEWNITLGFDDEMRNNKTEEAFNPFAPHRRKRVYKIVKIDAESGDFKGMLIREV